MVANEEELYRRVPNKPDFFKAVNGGTVFSSCAFNDPRLKPSVDRALLRGEDPHLTKKLDSDGVTSLITSDVRAIGTVVQNNPDGSVRQTHQIDVQPDPIEPENDEGLPENPAHALVVALPGFESKKTFNRLKESLARLASLRGWAVEPS